LLLPFKVFKFFFLDSNFSIFLRKSDLNILFKFFMSFSLLIIFCFYIIFFLLNSAHSFLESFVCFFLLLLKSFFVSIDWTLHLVSIFFNSFFLETQSLIFESLFSFKVNFTLSYFVHYCIIFLLKIINFVSLIKFFSLSFCFQLIHSSFFVLNLTN